MAHKSYGRLCKDCKCLEHRREYADMRDEVLAAYGAKCACCGETRRAFLAIDHVKNDGARHREEIGETLTKWLHKNKCPQDGRFQVLCHNCNTAKRWGPCPHKTHPEQEPSKRRKAEYMRAKRAAARLAPVNPYAEIG